MYIARLVRRTPFFGRHSATENKIKLGQEPGAVLMVASRSTDPLALLGRVSDGRKSCRTQA